MTTPPDARHAAQDAPPRDDEELPEKTFKRLYAFVLGFLALEIVVFQAITRWLS